MLFLSLLQCFIVAAWAIGDHEIQSITTELQLPDGKIRGSVLFSRLDKYIYSYRGLKYAEAPIGDRRFNQAVPVLPWSGIFDATTDGPACPQPGNVYQSEDCLRLNVYTKQAPPTDGEISTNVYKPVMVYIHGGNFYVSSSQSNIVGPQYLLDADIVLVTINYRLGSLGFLSTGDSLAPGNLGLKDQVEALRWVQRNIASFGGDRNSVTIMGDRSGSWSVSLHIVSPMSRGLFHRAIAAGGSAIYQTPLRPHQRDLARKQAKLLGCPTRNTTAILECLRTKNATEIADTLSRFFEWNSDPIIIWTPVIEPDVPGIERFLTDQPARLIRRGEFANVPLSIGISTDGGGIDTSTLKEAVNGNRSILDDLNENWYEIAPISFLYERNTTRSREISTAIKKFYFDEQPIGPNNVNQLSYLYADALVMAGANNLLQLMVRASTAPVYYYHCTGFPSFLLGDWTDGEPPFDELRHNILPFAFWDSHVPMIKLNSTAGRLSNIKIKYLTSFAKRGVPTPEGFDASEMVEWVPFTIENRSYMSMTDGLAMKTDLFKERIEFWEQLFPIPDITTFDQ